MRYEGIVFFFMKKDELKRIGFSMLYFDKIKVIIENLGFTYRGGIGSHTGSEIDIYIEPYRIKRARDQREY